MGAVSGAGLKSGTGSGDLAATARAPSRSQSLRFRSRSAQWRSRLLTASLQAVSRGSGLVRRTYFGDCALAPASSAARLRPACVSQGLASANRVLMDNGGARRKTELRQIPGVGPKNESLLLAHVDSLQTLKFVFQQKHGDQQQMRAWLQEVVGIRNSRHCTAIVGFLASRSSAQLSGSGLPAGGQGLTLSVEGNISAGKSTFLRILQQECVQLQELLEVVPEPVDRWQSVGSSRLNMLDMFYQDPGRFAYTFQNYVFISRVVQERESRGCIKPLRLLERSVFSDRMVFVRAVHEAKWLSDAELEVYDSWFDPVIRYLPGLVPQGFIYLRAEPDTCYRRMNKRNRSEESGVSLDYLTNLHRMHEDWLQSGFTPEQVNGDLIRALGGHNHPQPRPGSSTPNNRFSLTDTADYNVPRIVIEEPDEIKGNVRFLKGNSVHPALQNIPALVLDCDQDIDIENDVAAKEHFARQVTSFHKYVHRYMEWQQIMAGQPQRPAGLIGMHNGLGGHELGHVLGTAREGASNGMQRSALSFVA